MAGIAYKLKMEFTKLDGFDAEELWDVVGKFHSEPSGTIGETPIYVIDSEEIAERLSDPDYELTERERQIWTQLKAIADQEGGAFDLCLE